MSSSAVNSIWKKTPKPLELQVLLIYCCCKKGDYNARPVLHLAEYCTGKMGNYAPDRHAQRIIGLCDWTFFKLRARPMTREMPLRIVKNASQALL